MKEVIVKLVEVACEMLNQLDLDARIGVINEMRAIIHASSPFKHEPVDYIRWVRNGEVEANDYNPNSVAPPEMLLLQHSIREDGYTQPIVSWENEDKFEVVDGFHRNRVGKECEDIKARVHGYLPLVVINGERLDRNDRIASTIRHNRARGKHKIDAMSDIVVELKRRNWTDQRICKELGMDEDEVLRLCQITGLADLFKDQEFSRAWDIEGEVSEADFEELSDEVGAYAEETENFRVANTSDENRIFHTYEKWECYKAGFYATHVDGKTKAECEEAYRLFLSDLPRFELALSRVITEWKHSCEHYLSNAAMNRIAWLGQASACYDMAIPSVYRSGYFLLTEEQKKAANELALLYLNKWMQANGREPLTIEEAAPDRQSEIY